MQNEVTTDASKTSQTNKTAVVMGASIAGLVSARVLADHFDQVLILERDQLPDGPEYRPGAPQARQYHVLLRRGLQILEELFPGLQQELISKGAIEFDALRDTRVRMRRQWLDQFPSDQMLLSCSRLLLESVIRQRLRQNSRIRFIEGIDVTGLKSDDQHQAVTGVQVEWRKNSQNPQGSTEVFPADLVVDALGRRSPTPDWLVEMGYAAPQETVVDSHLGYVTRRYRQPENWQAGWRMMLILATAPDDSRGGLIFPEENNTWVVMIAGVNHDYPPTDEAGFDEFARSLGEEFYQAVQAAEPISQPYGYRKTDSRWRHYEQLERWPERYVVLGDAFCGFNPIYGQGMTIASMSALALGEQLQQANGQLDGVSQPTLKEIAKVTQAAWLLATGADLEWPGTTGGDTGQSLTDRFGRWYITKLMDAMPYEEQIRLAFNDVQQLIVPATALFAPGIMLRVFRHMI